MIATMVECFVQSVVDTAAITDSVGAWKRDLVAPQMDWLCVTVAGIAQWLCVLTAIERAEKGSFACKLYRVG
jgi:hypothetical protein